MADTEYKPINARDPAIQAAHPLPTRFLSLRTAQPEKDFLQFAWTLKETAPYTDTARKLIPGKVYPAIEFDLSFHRLLGIQHDFQRGTTSVLYSPTEDGIICIIGGLRAIDEDGDGDKAAASLNFARAHLVDLFLHKFPQLAVAAGMKLDYRSDGMGNESPISEGMRDERYATLRELWRNRDRWDETRCCNDSAIKAWNALRQHVKEVIEKGRCVHFDQSQPMVEWQVQEFNDGLKEWGFMFDEEW